MTPQSWTASGFSTSQICAQGSMPRSYPTGLAREIRIPSPASPQIESRHGQGTDSCLAVDRGPADRVAGAVRRLVRAGVVAGETRGATCPRGCHSGDGCLLPTRLGHYREFGPADPSPAQLFGIL